MPKEVFQKETDQFMFLITETTMSNNLSNTSYDIYIIFKQPIEIRYYMNKLKMYGLHSITSVNSNYIHIRHLDYSNMLVISRRIFKINPRFTVTNFHIIHKTNRAISAPVYKYRYIRYTKY